MNFIVKWWKGIEHPPHTAKINARLVIVDGQRAYRHWTSNSAHAIVKFYIRHWQWLIGSLLAIVLAVYFGK